MGSKELYFAPTGGAAGGFPKAGPLLVATVPLALVMVVAADARGWELDRMRCCSGAREETVPDTTDFDPGAPALETPDEVDIDAGEFSVLLFVNSCRTALDLTVAATAG